VCCVAATRVCSKPPPSHQRARSDCTPHGAIRRCGSTRRGASTALPAAGPWSLQKLPTSVSGSMSRLIGKPNARAEADRPSGWPPSASLTRPPNRASPVFFKRTTSMTTNKPGLVAHVGQVHHQCKRPGGHQGQHRCRCGVAWPRSEEASQRMSRPIATFVQGAAGRPTAFQAVRWDELPVTTAESEI